MEKREPRREFKKNAPEAASEFREKIIKIRRVAKVVKADAGSASRRSSL